MPAMDRPGDVTGATAIVLAGGRSSRMGTPKALLLFDGEPLIVHVVATLRRLFAEVVVVAAPGQSLPSMPVTLVRDEVEYQGPVGGIYYGLTGSRWGRQLRHVLRFGVSERRSDRASRLADLASTTSSCPTGRAAFSRCMRSIDAACCRFSKSSSRAGS